MTCYSTLKRNELLSHEQILRKLKRSFPKGYIQYDSNYMTFWRTMQTVKDQWLPGISEEEEMNRQSPEDV